MSQNAETAEITEGLVVVNLRDYAKLWKVCPNTIRHWMRTGKFPKKRHYARNGRVIRFFWSRELREELTEAWAEIPPARPRLTSRRGNRRELKLRA